MKARTSKSTSDPPFLQLYFERDEGAAALTKTHFRFEHWDPQRKAIVPIDKRTNRYEARSRRKTPVPWRPGVMAHAWYLVSCAALGATRGDNDVELPWSPVEKGGPVASIHELARKASSWRDEVFGQANINEIIKHQQINQVSYRRLDESLLSAHCVQVFLDGERLWDVDALDDLASDILEQFYKRRRTTAGADKDQHSQSRLRVRHLDSTIALDTRLRHISIGRSSKSDVVVDDPYVSWHHGAITLIEGSYRYRHFSKSGITQIRRPGITFELGAAGGIEELELRNHDRIVMGDSTLIVDFDLVSEDADYLSTCRLAPELFAARRVRTPATLPGAGRENC